MPLSALEPARRDRERDLSRQRRDGIRLGRNAAQREPLDREQLAICAADPDQPRAHRAGPGGDPRRDEQTEGWFGPSGGTSAWLANASSQDTSAADRISGADHMSAMA